MAIPQKRTALIGLTLAVAACSNMTSDSELGGRTLIGWTTTSCERAINYDANRIDFGGVSLPVGADEPIAVGNFTYEPSLIREATELATALDDAQYDDCVTANRLKGTDRYVEFVLDSNRKRDLLRGIALAFQGATDEEILRQRLSAIEDAYGELSGASGG